MEKHKFPRTFPPDPHSRVTRRVIEDVPFVASTDVFAASYDGNIAVDVHLFLVDIDGLKFNIAGLHAGQSLLPRGKDARRVDGNVLVGGVLLLKSRFSYEGVYGAASSMARSPLSVRG